MGLGINPINHARTRIDMHRYKVEPYVVAADVYAAPRHVGRGGWTWYTGSAGWMQRAGVESILGLRIEVGALRLDPCIPGSWPVRDNASTRHLAVEIVVENREGERGVAAAELDGEKRGAAALYQTTVLSIGCKSGWADPRAQSGPRGPRRSNESWSRRCERGLQTSRS